jgi:Ca2+-binding EF-hand superfamily protein
MLKVTRDVPGFTLLREVMRRSVEGLGVPFFLVCLLVSFFAGVLYWLEEETGTFVDVPEVMWFCIVTISTVGYGDVSPLTPQGRAFGTIFILFGLTAFAMPLGVISGNFAIVYEDKDEILMLRRLQSRIRGCGVGAEQLLRAFRKFDESGDGKLDIEEFSNLLIEFNVGLKSDSMQTLFSFFDDDKSGHLDYSEFILKVFPDVKIEIPQEKMSSALSNEDVLKAIRQIASQCETMEKTITEISAQSNKRLSALECAIPNLQTKIGLQQQ